jgi:CubicO group peptidase (beta-lactamase class C family)
MIAEKGKDTLALKRPPRPITLRDLLTHTSGLGNLDAPRPDCSLAELAMAYSQKPLEFEPGSKWSYCNPGINVLGRIVEVASGRPYAEFLETRLFRPLGMKDTTFWPTERQARRIAKSYQPGKDGRGLEETSVHFLKGALTSRTRTAFPAGGLYSTASDLAKFYQMVLRGDHRFLSEASIKQMTTTQTGDLKAGFVDGMSFGFGWGVVKEPTGVTAMLSPGTFGHGGAYGTQGWIDPKRDLILVMLIQRAKLKNGDASDMRRVFQENAVATIGK